MTEILRQLIDQLMTSSTEQKESFSATGLHCANRGHSAVFSSYVDDTKEKNEKRRSKDTTLKHLSLHTRP